MSEFVVNDVSKIQVTADSAPFDDGHGVAYWQVLTLLDAQGQQIGRIVMFLDRPEAALPVGDEPPYWGVDTSRALVPVDGEAPF